MESTRMDRRIQYEAEVKNLSDREIRERTWVALRVLDYYVTAEINGKVKVLWGDRFRRLAVWRVTKIVGGVIAGIGSLIIAGWKLL